MIPTMPKIIAEQPIAMPPVRKLKQQQILLKNDRSRSILYSVMKTNQGHKHIKTNVATASPTTTTK